MKSSGFYPLVLQKKKREFGQVHSLWFSAEESVPFLPGQYVHFLAPNSDPGRENVRHLSIASVPEEEQLLFSLDLDSSSDFKKKMAAMKVGETAHIFKIKGEFVLMPGQQREVVFLAGGIGITPIRSLILEVQNSGLPLDWRLLHVSRDFFLYKEELEVFPCPQKRVSRSGVEEVLDFWTAEKPSAWYYLSGSERFVEGMKAEVVRRGIPSDMIRIENFNH